MAASRKPRSPSTAGGGDHLRFLRPGALARLRDTRLRRASRTSRLPTPSSWPALASPPPTATGDSEGGAVMPYFVPVSGFLAPRCPQRKKLAAAKYMVLFSPLPPPPPTSTDLPLEAAIEFLNSLDMVVAAH
ncbi:uncharacterized protein LOC133889669 [Phragmites australis]|uniref:uncharacterized protein LOC133889669 n=1 Tax=Phragmites australis TaxID=29695 RepID=UPI002D79E61D|nr:uncharacterized protein LOC133889669 [Phragmites australis]